VLHGFLSHYSGVEGYWVVGKLHALARAWGGPIPPSTS
jgi:hypothetical protein